MIVPDIAKAIHQHPLTILTGNPDIVDSGQSFTKETIRFIGLKQRKWNRTKASVFCPKTINILLMSWIFSKSPAIPKRKNQPPKEAVNINKGLT